MNDLITSTINLNSPMKFVIIATMGSACVTAVIAIPGVLERATEITMLITSVSVSSGLRELTISLIEAVLSPSERIS